MLTCPETAALLRQWDQILVMSHASPDGDTLGSASALLRGLSSLGKQVDFLCADPVPEKFSYLFAGLPLGGFEPAHVMTVDVADKALLGKAPQELVARVELAIDHHGTHVPFAPQRWVEADSAATVELIYALLGELGGERDRAVADCLSPGLATETGCVRVRTVPPREIQGVVLGVTLKEKADGKVKVSVRANPPADASQLCSRLGGGGHQGAAGCSLGQVTLEQARQTMEQACAQYVKELGLL